MARTRGLAVVLSEANHARLHAALSLAGGGSVTADDAYVRESIVNPQAKVVAGFQPIMPTFQGLVSEEQLLQLIAYVRSLGQQAGTTAGTPGS